MAKRRIVTVGVVGAGTMSNAIAQAFAQAGRNVFMPDFCEEALRADLDAVHRSLDSSNRDGRVHASNHGRVRSRITTCVGIDPLPDFIGLEVCLNILRHFQEGLGDTKYRPCALLVRNADAGLLGRKSGRGFYDNRSTEGGC